MLDLTGVPRKSIAVFSTLTLGVTWTMELVMINSGIRFDGLSVQPDPLYWLLPLMLVPGVMGAVTARFVEGVPLSQLRGTLGLRVGHSFGPYFLTFLLIPLVFAAIYALSVYLGLASHVRHTGEVDIEGLWYMVFPLSIFLGPLINLLFGLGEEIGWRGFLLPRLLPLGKANAYILLGIIWGLWHAPLIWAGFNYPGHPLTGMAMMCLVATAFGFFLNEMTLHYRSTILAGFIHGAVNAQGYGIWPLLFPDTHPVLGGPFGMAGAACWLALGLITVWILPRLKRP